jgi:hypothetical protein
MIDLPTDLEFNRAVDDHHYLISLVNEILPTIPWRVSLPRIVSLSRATYRKMLQNLWWAAEYNIFAIPLAAGILAPWGFVLSPALGAILMSASTVVVAINAQLLRRVSL